MKVYIEGHDCQSPLREIIHAFTNDGEICFCESDVIKDGEWVYSSLEMVGEAVNVTTQICYKGKIHSDKREFSNYTSNLITNSVKAGYYLLARKVYGYDLPWGSHTGIRPARIAGDYILSGKDAFKELSEKYFIANSKAELAMQCAVKGMEMVKKASPKGVSLYVSIPYCPTRCLYCSFISTPVKSFEKQIIPYLNLLIKEIEYTGTLIKSLGVNIDTVYIGGGTPTILNAESLNRLINSLYNSFDLGSMLEFTVEAGRPDTVTTEKMLVLKNGGVNRISINPQTLNDSVLEKVGRRHTAQDFARAFEIARECGHDNINTDIIVGLPSENGEMFKTSLEKLLKFSPDSVTVHTMCIKRASKLKTELENHVAEFGVASKMVDLCQKLLNEKGYLPYYLYRQKDTLDNLENTGYSLPNKECLYNVLMMDDVQSIIAMGAGGVTKLVHNNRIERIFNLKNPTDYIKRFDDIIARKDRMVSIYHEMGL